jgi:SAM-dependent methyltransferase
MTDSVPSPQESGGENPERWGEDTSQQFLEISEVFVPGRVEQADMLLGLIPARQDESFAIVELAAGGGELAEKILEQFPNCHYLALDGSVVMLEQLNQRLARFGERVTIRLFDIAARDWRAQLLTPLRCVCSSLCVHHLYGEGKRQLFNDMAQLLEPGGALLLADIIQPASQQIAALFARQYDDLVREQSLAVRGDLSGFTRFQEMHWNYFRYDIEDPDDYDHPSLLSDQLRWLSEAGFSRVDCYWMRAGHAVYGGYK